MLTLLALPTSGHSDGVDIKLNTTKENRSNSSLDHLCLDINTDTWSIK